MRSTCSSSASAACGGPRAHRPPGLAADLAHYTDPLPQALVLTAIVIGFATTALFLVVLLALRGLSGTDHVDGQEETACPAAGGRRRYRRRDFTW
jgi:multisubunit Na+/H+ antiporter MnhC subunit